jgi:hypothetical protein
MDSPLYLCEEEGAGLHLECSPARGSPSTYQRASSSSGLALRSELESSTLPECCGSMATDSMVVGCVSVVALAPKCFFAHTFFACPNYEGYKSSPYGEGSYERQCLGAHCQNS